MSWPRYGGAVESGRALPCWWVLPAAGGWWVVAEVRGRAGAGCRVAGAGCRQEGQLGLQGVGRLAALRRVLFGLPPGKRT